MGGYDLDLVRQVREAVHLALTVLGGAGSRAHIEALIRELGIIGAAAGSLFVFKGVYRAVLIDDPDRAGIRILGWLISGGAETTSASSRSALPSPQPLSPLGRGALGQAAPVALEPSLTPISIRGGRASGRRSPTRMRASIWSSPITSWSTCPTRRRSSPRWRGCYARAACFWLTIMGRGAPAGTRKRHLAPDRPLTPTLPRRARERMCFANLRVGTRTSGTTCP